MKHDRVAIKVSSSVYLHVFGLGEEIHSDTDGTNIFCGSGLNPGPSSCEATVLTAVWWLAQHISALRDTVNVCTATLWSHTNPIERCNASRFLLTWENMTGGGSGILGRRLWIQQLAGRPPREAAISIKPPLFWADIHSAGCRALRWVLVEGGERGE